MKNQKNQKKRTLKAFLEKSKKWWRSASKKERNELAGACALMIFTIAMFVGFGVLLTTPADYGQKEAIIPYTPAQSVSSEKTDDRVGTATQTEPDAAPIPTRLVATEDNAFYNARFAATETYSYQKISDISEEFPDDCAVLRFRVDKPTVRTEPGTTFCNFKNDTLGYQFTLSCVDLGEVSSAAAEYGYPVIGVFVKDVGSGLASLECFAFDPEEDPWIEINMCSGGPPHAYARMEPRVFACGFSSRTERVSLSTYRSTGVSYGDYAFWGGSEGGNDEYYFGRATVIPAVTEFTGCCRPLEYSLENLAAYRAHLEEIRS